MFLYGFVITFIFRLVLSLVCSLVGLSREMGSLCSAPPISRSGNFVLGKPWEFVELGQGPFLLFSGRTELNIDQ